MSLYVDAQKRFKERTMSKSEYKLMYALYRINPRAVPCHSFVDTFNQNTLLGHLTWAWDAVYWMQYPDSVGNYMPESDEYEPLWAAKMAAEIRE